MGTTSKFGTTLSNSNAYYLFNDSLTSTYLGFESGSAVTTANKCTVIGYQAGKSITTANGCTFIGQQAGYLHDTGNNNTYIGDEVAADPSVGARTAQRNTFVGQSAGYSIKTGSNNVFIGKNTGGGGSGVGPAQSQNVFVGSLSGQANTADNNVFIGYNSGVLNSSGTQNIFIGSGAGTSVTTGSLNIIIGYNIAGTAALANVLNIGNIIHGNLSTTAVSIGGATPNAAAMLEVRSTTLGFLLPRMTTAQKTAIASPVAGLMVYDTTLNKACVYTTTWETITSV